MKGDVNDTLGICNLEFVIMLQVNGLEKTFGSQLLFKNAQFILGQGEKVGLVGRNGSGKSTLFRIVLGSVLADKGEVSFPKNYKIASLDQHISFSFKTVREECSQKLSLEESYKAEKILFGVGFSKEDMDRSPLEFSGGLQIRIQLAKVLIENPNLLLLDEPTNYLDILGLRWLAQFLRNFSGELILITHDRNFMDSVVTHVMGIYRQSFKKLKGDTSNFYEKMALEDELHEKARQNQLKKVEHLEKFVERFKSKASKATQAQSKLKQISKIKILSALDEETSMALNFHYESCAGKVLMKVENLAFSYDADFFLFKNINFFLGNGEKIAIIGKNGKGKSTLLNVLSGEFASSEGEISFHQNVLKGHFGQTNVLRLDPEKTIVEEIYESNTFLSKTAVRSICGAMMFSGDLADKKVKVLSGGEKARVLLGKILAKPSNLLLLDEPTNHLDMESIEILLDSLVSFKGSVIIVTHNEYLLRAVADRLIVFKNETSFLFDGNYDEFLEKIGWDDDKREILKNEKIGRKELKKQKAEWVKKRSETLNPLKRRVEALEKMIEEKESFLAKKNEQLLLASEQGNGEKISELSKSLSVLSKEIDELFSEFEEATLLYEEEEEKFLEISFDS